MHRSLLAGSPFSVFKSCSKCVCMLFRSLTSSEHFRRVPSPFKGLPFWLKVSTPVRAHPICPRRSILYRLASRKLRGQGQRNASYRLPVKDSGRLRDASHAGRENTTRRAYSGRESGPRIESATRGVRERENLSEQQLLAIRKVVRGEVRHESVDNGCRNLDA